MLRVVLPLITSLLMLTALGGCGNKSDLYLPEDNARNYTLDTVADK